MGQRLSFLLLSVSILVVAATSMLHAQDPKTGEDPGKKNLFTSLSDVNQGRNFFNIMCARCHGRNARGGRGPDLTDGVFRYARTDEEVQQIIVNGVPGTDMA
ncbi:MAG: c-type cytochrome, partial [Pirellulaceae bacterium]|nr:c-type cytochrome [Pirellulaceae bacterium]